MNIILHYAVLLSDYNKINSQRHYTYDNILLDIKKNTIMASNIKIRDRSRKVSEIVRQRQIENIHI